MLLVARSAAWHVATPLLPFSRPPVGVGDLTSGLFLANLLHGKTPPEALEHTASAYFAVMQAPRCQLHYHPVAGLRSAWPGCGLPACPLTWSLSREPGDRGRRRVRAAARGGAGRPRRTQAVVRGQAAPRARAFVTGRYFGTRVAIGLRVRVCLPSTRDHDVVVGLAPLLLRRDALLWLLLLLFFAA